ncbi:MAG: T9SS type A sorting domain-containing protein [Dysgonomonas sp.]
MKKIITLVILCFIWISNAYADLPLLKPLLDAQISNSSINIPKGKYLFDAVNHGNYTFSDLNNVTIDLNGSEIICNKASNVFTFNNCTNVTVKNFSIDFDPLLFTQGTITAVDSSKGWFDFTVDEGYPITDIAATRTQFFDSSTRKLKRNSLTIYESGLTITKKTGTDNQFRASKLYSWDALEAVGDLVVFSRTGSGHCFYMYKCSNMTIENVTLYGASTFAFFENETDNSHYQSCKISLKKDETERPSARLRSVNADGIHSKNAKIGPTIEGCEIAYGGDDCIAINGAMYPIYKVDASTRSIYFLSSGTSAYLGATDSIQLVSYDGSRKGVVNVEILKSATPTTTEINAFLSKYTSLSDRASYTNGFQIRVNEIPTDLAAGDVLYNKDKIGSGFSIRNNLVGHIRSRAILIKAGNGIISNNIIEDCEMGGIVLSPEYDWMEAGFSSNVEISYNTITNCMFGRSSTSGKAGALSVMCIGGNKSIAPAGAYSNINIHNNAINDCPQPAVVVTSVDGLTYENNTYNPDYSTIRVHGQAYGVPNNVSFWTKNISYNSGIDQNAIDSTIDYISVADGKIIFKQNVPARFKVFSLQGKLMYQEILSRSGEQINLSGLVNGVYLLTIQTSDNIYSHKIIL